MKLWNNLKWLWRNDFEGSIPKTIRVFINRYGADTAATELVMDENEQAADSVFPDNQLWMFASVGELFKENRAEYYTVSAIRLLNGAGIHSVAQLTTQTARDLRKIKGMGTNTIGYIQDSLARQGLALGGK